MRCTVVWYTNVVIRMETKITNFGFVGLGPSKRQELERSNVGNNCMHGSSDFTASEKHPGGGVARGGQSYNARRIKCSTRLKN